MEAREIALPVAGGGGELAAIDFGGGSGGPEVLLVHGSGHNAAAWTDVAAELLPHCGRLVAVDLRGHGRTALDSTAADQYWRDLGDAVAALGWQRPVLVGHSLGGYAVTAATAAGLIEPAAVCTVDGLVLDDRATAARRHAGWRKPSAHEDLRELFRYGWRATADERDAHVEECVRRSPKDWLNSGARPGLLRELTARSFAPDGDHWVRRPLIEEIVTLNTANPADPVYPSVDVYDLLHCPFTVVLATRGFYAQRRAEVVALTEARPERTLIDIDSHHNVPTAHPAALAAIIKGLR
ncbi:alpha/beta fold hydrolase [Streptomyces harbinensis]|uniref:alpha/beta fold hydrolase n=1 Tax=Streptomyces harbinensis TaxID=1176198 RepID=UPI0036C498A6